jgi:hypothetical protein
MSLSVVPKYLSLALETNPDLVESGILTYRNVGDLMLPSGKLVACDLLVDHDMPPFNLTIAPGSYPVVLAIAHFPARKDQRVAFASVRLNPNRPVKWQMLAVGEESLSDLKEGEIFGYGVDSGTGSFMDRQVAEAVGKAMAASNDLDDQIVSALDATYVHTWGWANIPLAPGNLIAFSSGWGDGFYASYVGSDESERPCVVVTDFDVVEIKARKS